jgi:hypothetical protein
MVNERPIPTAGATVRVQSEKACVVFDAASGEVHHHHGVITLAGGTEPTADQIAADAMKAVRRWPDRPAGQLDVLHIAHDAFQPGRRYRVDVSRGRLVADE